jgi:single-stranded-DNA-specific exonuclease
MSLGIACLLTNDDAEAMLLAQKLDELNQSRRQIESEMHEDAIALLENIQPASQFTICLYDETWHQGVIGILASKIKERFHRPVIAFAEAGDGLLKGSGRSIAGLHLRDALDLVSKKHPALILRFGGHAMAAGLTIARESLAEFEATFERAVSTMIGAAALSQVIEVDGGLQASDFNLTLAEVFERQIWGQGFPEPLFVGDFKVLEQRVVGEKHLKLKLSIDRLVIDAIFFGYSKTLPSNIKAVYQLQVNSYRQIRSVQLMIKEVEFDV